MKNKIELKKNIFFLSLVFILFVILNISLIKYFSGKYQSVYEGGIENILMDTNDTSATRITIRDKVLLEDEIIYNKQDSVVVESIITSLVSNILLLTSVIIIFYFYEKNKARKMDEIFRMVEEVSMGNYSVDFEKYSEDELSIVRDNLYKITKKLKEESVNSKSDREVLKNSLDNISHQLKTPITAISISLDNILDNDLTDDKRREFLFSIKKEISNINFLIKSMLQLSRLSSNVVKFNRKENSLLNIINESLDRVDLLRDLKNIKVEVIGEDSFVLCDFHWEIEALSNIIKNAIEHSENDDTIKIELYSCEAFKSVKITNHGILKDKDKIFKRFYSGKETSDSIGIGLVLSKDIVERDNGKIYVDSNFNVTTFEIKYFNF